MSSNSEALVDIFDKYDMDGILEAVKKVQMAATS
jgi:hypothetical protein